MPEQTRPRTDEKYCSSCGEVIKEKAEICPECGVRQSESPEETKESYDVLFSIYDSLMYQKPLRHILNIVLAVLSFGLHLGLVLGEGFYHYRNLNNGDIEPYDESKDKVWWVGSLVN
jgi:predicted RNA-binding Zn-ribbon protein involved in translation (DUF1610 family)